MKQKFLGIEQQKGSQENLKGRLIAYALVPNIPNSSSKMGGIPFDEIVQNGILAVMVDYSQDQSVKHLIDQIHLSKDSEGIEGVEGVEAVEGLEEPNPLDPNKEPQKNPMDRLFKDLGSELDENLSDEEIMDKLEQLTHIEVIPVPARIGNFDSVDEILSEDADIFFLGEFQNPHNAQLSATTFPIIYQSAFKEQQSLQVNEQIDEILSSAESLDSLTKTAPSVPSPSLPPLNAQEIHTVREALLQTTYKRFSGHLGQFLTQKIIPLLTMNLSDYDHYFLLFRRFMQEYPFPEDLARLEVIIPSLASGDSRIKQEIDLLCQKFSALREEKFEKLIDIQNQLTDLDN